MIHCCFQQPSVRMTGLYNKFFRFILTGSVAAVVDIGGFALLSHLGIPITVSAVTSFCLAVVANYLMASHFTFKQPPTISRFMLFFMAALGGLVINVTATVVGSAYLGIAPVLAKILGAGIALLLNFWMSLRVVFRSRGARSTN